jgi:hypothetical protein
VRKVKPSISEIIHRALTTPRPAIKKIVRVKAKYRRDKKGRFSGPRLRRAHSRVFRDPTRMISPQQQLAENVSKNNTLLQRLMRK